MESGIRVLVVDDDAELCELIAEYLTARGFVVDTEGDGERGLKRIRQDRYALMVLDVLLPGIDGFEVLRRVRAGAPELAELPVVMLTAHGDEVDRIVGLELGADDYLAKPFNTRELLARIRAILRRAGSDGKARPPLPAVAAPSPERRADVLHLGDLEADVAARAARRDGQALELTAIEFDLLVALMRAAGRVLKREELARDVLNRKLLPFDRSLDMHMSKLRRKLGPGAGGTERIKTVRGVGYILVKERP